MIIFSDKNRFLFLGVFLYAVFYAESCWAALNSRNGGRFLDNMKQLFKSTTSSDNNPTGKPWYSSTYTMGSPRYSVVSLEPRFSPLISYGTNTSPPLLMAPPSQRVNEEILKRRLAVNEIHVAYRLFEPNTIMKVPLAFRMVDKETPQEKLVQNVTDSSTRTRIGTHAIATLVGGGLGK